MPAKGKRRSLRQRKIISYSEDHDPEKTSSESLQPRRKKVNKRQKKQISKDSEEEFTVESIHEETEEEDISYDESDQISTPKDTPKKRICLVTKKVGGKQKSKITPLAKESSGSIRVKVKKRKDSKNLAIEAQKSALEENSKDDDQDKHESIEEKLKDLSIDLDSDFEIDPIFKRYAYDYEKNKYMQKDQRIYPQDRKRIKFIEKIKTKLEAEKERDEDGVPITNINVELSKRNKIVKRRPLEPLSFKQSKENIELSIDQEPLVKSSDAKRTNSKKMAQKEFINKQKEKYAQRIGYLPDYEPPQQSKDSMKKTILTEEEALAKQKDSQEEDGMNQSLKQTLLGTESLQNGDTTIEQMEWELESKLSDKEIEYLAKQKKRIIVYINNNIRMDDNYLL
eukprot:CAMPEP_0196996152 /NCGR_PEP_ID=MMETSP1380-20130617/2111_1 /TAXON_ID=5936 /ORGANISM="Euplotes crassus, Strain CT5" /LENGTH=395 /DNA_ID=CAMNT_0042412037 /DNA_START=127 /DNA_END=1314 /DNA_ORIENTATION=+